MWDVFIFGSMTDKHIPHSSWSERSWFRYGFAYSTDAYSTSATIFKLTPRPPLFLKEGAGG